MNAAPDALHLLAHRAGLRQRERQDWWGSAIETALAGVSATRHPAAQREQAEQALAGLERWARGGSVRPISADAVALALAARIAATLGRSDAGLREAAVTAVEAMARRTQEVIPELHVALVVWGLEAVVPDRRTRPWPALRERLQRGNVYGVDAGLRAYASAVAAVQLDATGLAQCLITITPTSPELSDAGTVLWLLAVALDVCAAALPVTDSGLRALLQRRASITGRLAVELDADAFRPPQLKAFDPTAPPEDTPAAYFSSMEALMLDIALAPAADEAAWLTLPQAERLLGQHAREARTAARRERLRSAIAFAASAVLAGAALCFGLVVAGSSWHVSITFAAALALAVAAIAVAVAHSVLGRRTVTGAAGAACVTGSLCAALNAVNQLLTKPLLPDAAGVIAGAALASTAALVWALLAGRDRDLAVHEKGSARRQRRSPAG
jgi:hypothetical protein